MVNGKEGNSGKRPKRRGGVGESDTPFSPQAIEVHGPDAVRAFRCSVYGLIPGVGLLLGPLALLLGFWACMKHRKTPERKGVSMAKAAMWLGFFLGLTQWMGLTLMILALAGD